MAKRFKFIDPKRGYLLSILIAILSLLTISSLPSFFNGNYLLAAQTTHKIIPNWYSAYFLTGIIVNLAALVGIWFWQKWAFYLDIIMLFIFIAVELYVLVNINPISMLVLLGTLNLVFYWAIYSKWRYFK